MTPVQAFQRPVSWILLLLACFFITPGRCTICAGLDYFTANSTSASFTSPDYPSNYGINLYCTWMIEAVDSSHVIRMTVDTSSLENPDGSGSCSFDYARVYDGRDMSATLLAEWCGDSTLTVTSTGIYMLIVFRSDYATVSTGFQASYFAGIFPTVSSSTDYTIIIAASTSAFVVIVGGIIAFCCIRQNLKKKKRAKQAGEKQTLPENDGDTEKYNSEGGRSIFTHRIISSREGKRLQPLETANDANEPADPAKEEKKRKKAEEKAKRKAEAEARKAKRGNKKVGFEEFSPEAGTTSAGVSTAPGNPDSEATATSQGAGASKSDPQGKTSPGSATPSKEGQITKDGKKMVLLPTVVMVDSADQLKRQKVEGKWSHVSSNQAEMTTNLARQISNDNDITEGNPRVRATHSTVSLEKDEGIHLDYEGGESGKSSPASRPSATPTLTSPLQRESSVVSPSLVTSSFVSQSPLNQPVPIEAPTTAAGKPGKRPASSFASSGHGTVKEVEKKVDQVISWPQNWSYKCPELSGEILNESGSRRASTAKGTRKGVTTTKPPPIKDAFLKEHDSKAFFQKGASGTPGHGDNSVPKGAKQGRTLSSR